MLSIADVCDYLTMGHEPTSVAVLLGMAGAKAGKPDNLLAKTLFLHIPSLLPPRYWEVEISPVVQTAAIAGLGLLFRGTAHRLMTEFLLEELGRRPTSDRCDTRESSALAAGIALGMVLLNKGTRAPTAGDGGGVRISSWLIDCSILLHAPHRRRDGGRTRGSQNRGAAADVHPRR